jgi:hypothetical protein
MNGYFFNLLVAVDQLVNTVAGGNPDETISLRAAKARAKGEQWGCVLCRVLDLFAKGHCDKVTT